ncbi:MAG: nucleotidyl transferase AbiEii/AbiGii toxin family protein [Desulfobacterales bacterium]
MYPRGSTCSDPPYCWLFSDLFRHLSLFQNDAPPSRTLEVDLNFMFRQPLWDVRSVDSQFLGDLRATNIPVLDIHELAAGKLCALMARQQGRDLFDSHQLLNHNDLEQKRLRLAFVVYGAMNRKDWRTVSLHDIDFAADELSHQLLPLFHIKSARGDESPVYYGKGNRDD